MQSSFRSSNSNLFLTEGNEENEELNEGEYALVIFVLFVAFC